MIKIALAFILSLSLTGNGFAASAAAGGPITEASVKPVEKKKIVPQKKRSIEKRKRRRKNVSPKASKKAAPKKIRKKAVRKPAKRAPVKKPRSRRTASSSDGTDALLAFGASAAKAEGGLRILHIRRGSPAEDLGLKSRDTLLTLNGRRTRTPIAAAQALRSWKPETRLSAVVNRVDSKIDNAQGRADLRGKLLSLESPAQHWPRPVLRDAEQLSLREAARAQSHKTAAREGLKAPLKSLKAPSFRVAAGERIWVHFPKGIPQSVQAGDVVEGETSTAMAADNTLDFLVIPQGSRIWAQVVSSKAKGGARIVTLVVFKIGLDGGKIYPCSAMVRAISGTEPDVMITSGGSLVSAPTDEAELLFPSKRNLQIEFRKDLVIFEPIDFYKSGPGLWLRSAAGSNGPYFEISHIIRGRSAHAAGLEKGDRVTHIGGRPVQRLGFSEAIRLLYGSPGTRVEIKVIRASSRSAERVRLQRGAGYRKGYGLKLSSGKDGAYVLRIDEDSPAYLAGIRRGYRIDSIDGTALAGVGKRTLKQLLKPTDTERTIVFKPRDRRARSESILAVPYPYARSMRGKLKNIH